MEMKTKIQLAEEYLNSIGPLGKGTAEVDFLAGFDACEKMLKLDFANKTIDSELYQISKNAERESADLRDELWLAKKSIQELEAEIAKLKSRYEVQYMGRP